MTREVSPLVKAEDAVEMDTSGMTAEGMAERIIKEYGSCLKSC